ncbi:hypothetical protein [Streptomyces sp. NPDC058683]|uniref:hypothetical protein n=1 Tax=Streptomyces sp. NPDC058683 TaxID=3346597 RepID=UPI00364AFFF3
MTSPGAAMLRAGPAAGVRTAERGAARAVVGALLVAVPQVAEMLLAVELRGVLDVPP